LAVISQGYRTFPHFEKVNSRRMVPEREAFQQESEARYLGESVVREFALF
jgi:hypothetical protein